MKAPRRPRRIRKAPATLDEALAMFDGEREGRAGLPDIEADIARLKTLLAQAGFAIVPLRMNLVDSEPMITGPQIRAALAMRIRNASRVDLGFASNVLRWSAPQLASDKRSSRKPCAECGKRTSVSRPQ